VREVRKPHLRGGAHQPLTDEEVEAKFRDNLRFGSWDSRRATQLREAIERIVAGGKVDLSAARS
jgi:hypothetical protein